MSRYDTRSTLIRRARDLSDAAVWREVVELYEPLIRRWISRWRLQEADSRDLLQDVMWKLAKALPKFELDRRKGRFRTWLYRLVQNAMTDWARRKRNLSRLEMAGGDAIHELPDENDELERAWTHEYQKAVLDRVLKRIGVEERPVKVLCFRRRVIEGRAIEDIATELGITGNAVYVNVSRIRKRVEVLCREYYEEDLFG